MADVKKLKGFQIEQEGDGFLLRMEDESGAVLSAVATHDQLDLIADDIEDQLDADEESDLVDAEENEEKH